MASIVAASYNIKYTLSPQVHQNAVCQLIKRTPAMSVLGLQETGRAHHPKLRDIKGWRLIAPQVPDGAPNPTPDPLMIRKDDWKVEDIGYHKLNPVRSGMGPNTIGGDVERARFVVWARLKSREDGGVWVVGNMHLIPAPNVNAAHKRVYREQMGNLLRWVRPRINSRVILLGDFNSVWNDPLNKPLRDEGLESVHQVKRDMAPSTRGKDIDHVWWYKAGNEVAWAKVVRNLPSDHKPVVAKVRST
jgi:endonuclease/exonuclease/phosphatase family metal-dependent hydrolase